LEGGLGKIEVREMLQAGPEDGEVVCVTWQCNCTLYQLKGLLIGMVPLLLCHL
jgi:hypothetical protein